MMTALNVAALPLKTPEKSGFIRLFRPFGRCKKFLAKIGCFYICQIMLSGGFSSRKTPFSGNVGSAFCHV